MHILNDLKISGVVVICTDSKGFEFKRTRFVHINPVMVDLSVQQITSKSTVAIQLRRVDGICSTNH